MALTVQIQTLLYHFFGGIVFAFFFSFLSLLLIRMSIWMRILVLNVFCLSSTLFFFYGLYQINNGITHIYALLFLFLGISLFYQLIYLHLLPIFLFLLKIMSPFVRKGRVAKKKIYGIIKNGKGNKGSRKKERIRWKIIKKARNAQ